MRAWPGHCIQLLFHKIPANLSNTEEFLLLPYWASWLGTFIQDAAEMRLGESLKWPGWLCFLWLWSWRRFWIHHCVSTWIFFYLLLIRLLFSFIKITFYWLNYAMRISIKVIQQKSQNDNRFIFWLGTSTSWSRTITVMLPGNQWRKPMCTVYTFQFYMN